MSAECGRGFPDAAHPHSHHKAVLLGGKYGGRKVGLSGAPLIVDVAGLSYVRRGDPQDGTYLGQYIYRPGSEAERG